MQDLSSSTRDPTHAPCSGIEESKRVLMIRKEGMESRQVIDNISVNYFFTFLTSLGSSDAWELLTE